MKILVAVDENTYSRYAVNLTARLAANTWPDLVMLAVENPKAHVVDDSQPLEDQHPQIMMLRRYRHDFLETMGADGELYACETATGTLHLAGPKILEETASGRKSFALHVRRGNPTKAILAESRETQSDMIIIGCEQSGCDWGRDAKAPGKVADGADCSVFVIKEDRVPSKVVCCLDHADVTQESLETINQLVTVYGAELEIVGVLKHGELQEHVESKMGDVLNYYLDRGVQALIRVVDEDSLDSFIAAGGEGDLMALWLTHKSPLQRILSGNRIATLVNRSVSSILILR